MVESRNCRAEEQLIECVVVFRAEYHNCNGRWKSLHQTTDQFLDAGGVIVRKGRVVKEEVSAVWQDHLISLTSCYAVCGVGVVLYAQGPRTAGNSTGHTTYMVATSS